MHTSINTFAFAQDSKTPEWVKNKRKPDTSSEHYYVGCSVGATGHQEALRQAQLNALENIASREFPELTTLSVEGKESLKKSESKFEQNFVNRYEKIRWSGLEVADEYLIEEGEGEKKTLSVCKLLKWSTQNIKLEREAIKRNDIASDASASVSMARIGDAGKPTGSLKVVTVPDGADIVLDGKHIGKSNGNFKSVTSGLYEITIALDDYDVVKKEITIVAGVENSQRIELKKVKGTSEIKSVPEGATIYLNNIPVGKSPVVIEREKGTYSVRAELPNYNSQERKIEVDVSAGSEVFSLKIKPSKLSVVSTPSGATVSIDGEPKGKTPLFSLTVPGGKHSITLKKDGFIEHSEDVEVYADKSKTVTVRMVSVSAKDRIEAEQKKKEREKNNAAIAKANEERDRIEKFKDADPSEYARLKCANGDTLSCETLKKINSSFVLKAGGWGLLGASVGSFLYASSLVSKSRSAYDDYKAATVPTDVTAKRRKVEAIDDNIKSANGLGVLSGILGVVCIYYGYHDYSVKVTEMKSNGRVYALSKNWEF